MASYLLERQAHYHFTVKGNQPGLHKDIALLFHKRAKPDYEQVSPPDHGRIETRRIWCSTALNVYLDFPHVGQAFMIEREVLIVNMLILCRCLLAVAVKNLKLQTVPCSILFGRSCARIDTVQLIRCVKTSLS